MSESEVVVRIPPHHSPLLLGTNEVDTWYAVLHTLHIAALWEGTLIQTMTSPPFFVPQRSLGARCAPSSRQLNS